MIDFAVLSKNIPGLEMFLIDEDMHVRCRLGQETFNQRWHEEFVENKGFFSYFLPETKTIIEPLLRIAFQETPVSREFSLNNNFFSIRIIPYTNGSGEVLCAVILQNITEAKVIEYALRNSMKEVEEANKAKDIFLARMSHEIRTPLSAAIGFAEQLKGTRLTKKQSDYVDIVNNSSRHLLSILDDILVLSKIESGTIELDEMPFTVNNVLEDVDKMLEARYIKKGLNFYWKTDFLKDYTLLGDAEKLKQVLTNLANNAIKFTKKGEVMLVAKLVNEDKNNAKICFEVTDTGIGIAPGKIKEIFKPFQQVNNHLDRNFQGCGLGLTISKDLVESLGGELTVKSTPGTGSTFSFTLEFEKSTDPVSESNIVPEKTGKILPKSLRILFVDDDPVNLLLGKVILKKFRIKADFAESGEQALAFFKPGRYNMIFLDINLPDKSGPEVAQCIREKEKNSEKRHNTTIVAMTANALRKQLVYYLKAGMDSILVKPYSEESFFQIINRFTGGWRDENTENRNIQSPDKQNEAKDADFFGLLNTTKGDKEFTLLMLNTFVKNTGNMIKKLRSCLKRNDYAMIGEVAHKLSPSVEQMGFKKSLALLKIIEKRYLRKTGAKKDPGLIRETIDLLQNDVALVQQKISELS
ncbi:MAG: response regulator [Bacteroidia bacterium]|nr:MAG: response regulator [Bacteroidia bacterium]